MTENYSLTSYLTKELWPKIIKAEVEFIIMEEAEEPFLGQDYLDKDGNARISAQLEENNSQGEAFLRHDTEVQTLYPYTVEYKNDIIHLDSKNWRESNVLKIQIISAFIIFILSGMVEQTVGTLIPELQKHYNIKDVQTSTIYFANVTGYLVIALANNFIHHMLGIKGVTIMAATLMTICYLIISLRPPFFIFVIVYILNGIGLGCLDTTFNTWMGNLVDSNQLLGILHGCYGIGCMISPALITTLLEKEKHPWKWNQYYILLAIESALCLVLLAFTFKHETAKKLEYMLEVKAHENDIEMSNFEIDSDDEDYTLGENDKKLGPISLADALKSKLVWAFSIMLFLYVGAEVAFGQWVVSFMMRVEDYSYDTSSYMASCFWTGLTVGRVCLGFVTATYFKTELMANMFYISVTFASYFIFLLFTFLKLKILFFAILFVAGVFTGPIFPTTIVSSLNILPMNYHNAGVGFICAFGGAGAAAIPLLVGIISEASKLGLRTLPLIVLSSYVCLTTGWLFVTKKYIGIYGKNRL